MTPLDLSTLDSDTPRTLDGRAYPEHLRAYEQFDGEFLAIVAKLEPATFDDLSFEIDEPRARASLPRWLASA